jgi:general secretion pathway protein A
MVLDYYGLNGQPFGVTPDSRYLYSSATHREALASLLYSVEVGRGFAALIAKPGMGKTTLLFHALNELKDKAKTVFLYQTIPTPMEFLHAVLADLGVLDTQSNFMGLQTKLNEVVTQQSRTGKPLILIIDEAQALDDSVLEMVRMLSNFETSREKLIQIVLSGQPQLADKLASPELVQLRQRVSIVACLKEFSPEETALYVDHRLRAAGYSAEEPLFTKNALDLIAESSEGIPRNINNLCFNAMSLGCALRRKTINCTIIREVMADLDLDALRDKKPLVRGAEPMPMPQPVQVPAPVQVQAPVQLAVPIQLPVPSVTQEASVIASAPRFQSMRKAWLTKLAAACAVLVILGGVLFESPRWMAPTATARTNNASARVPDPGASRADQTPRGASAGEVRVTAGQTLYIICVQSFGSCDSKLLQQIQTLNPWLTDINHIEPGQTIRIPVINALPGPMLPALKQSGNTLSTKRVTQ